MPRNHPSVLSLLTTTTSLLFTLSHAQVYGHTGGVSNVSSSACPAAGGAHIIVARASYEPQGYGVIGVVKDNILAAVPGSNAEAVVYPAVINPNYIESESDGVVAMRELIRAFVAKCADAPLVIMGYSQGAQVSTDSLVGQDVAGFPDNSTINTPLPASTLARVAAVVLMGDPSFTLNETFLQGTTIKNGLFPRRNYALFESSGLAARAKSYCDAGDPYCASGSNLTVHLLYVPEYGADALTFVTGQIKSYNGNSTSGGSANGTNSTAPSSTSPSPSAYTGAASRVGGMGLMSTVAGAIVMGVVLALTL